MAKKSGGSLNCFVYILTFSLKNIFFDERSHGLVKIIGVSHPFSPLLLAMEMYGRSSQRLLNSINLKQLMSKFSAFMRHQTGRNKCLISGGMLCLIPRNWLHFDNDENKFLQPYIVIYIYITMGFHKTPNANRTFFNLLFRK